MSNPLLKPLLNPVLYALCRHCVSIMDGWIPYPSTCIADTLNMPLGKVRYQLKKLKAQGLVVGDRYVDKSEDGVILVNGYTLTEKGKHTSEYAEAEEVERKVCKECFGIDI